MSYPAPFDSAFADSARAGGGRDRGATHFDEPNLGPTKRRQERCRRAYAGVSKPAGRRKWTPGTLDELLRDLLLRPPSAEESVFFKIACAGEKAGAKVAEYADAQVEEAVLRLDAYFYKPGKTLVVSPTDAAFAAHHGGKSRARLLGERCTSAGGSPNWVLRGTVGASVLLLLATITLVLQIYLSASVGKDLLGPIMYAYAPIVTSALVVTLLVIIAASFALRRQLDPDKHGRSTAAQAQAAEVASTSTAASVIELGFWALFAVGLACLALALDLFAVPVHPAGSMSSTFAAEYRREAVALGLGSSTDPDAVHQRIETLRLALYAPLLLLLGLGSAPLAYTLGTIASWFEVRRGATALALPLVFCAQACSLFALGFVGLWTLGCSGLCFWPLVPPETVLFASFLLGLVLLAVLLLGLAFYSLWVSAAAQSKTPNELKATLGAFRFRLGLARAATVLVIVLCAAAAVASPRLAPSRGAAMLKTLKFLHHETLRNLPLGIAVAVPPSFTKYYGSSAVALSDPLDSCGLPSCVDPAADAHGVGAYVTCNEEWHRAPAWEFCACCGDAQPCDAYGCLNVGYMGYLELFYRHASVLALLAALIATLVLSLAHAAAGFELRDTDLLIQKCDELGRARGTKTCTPRGVSKLKKVQTKALAW